MNFLAASIESLGAKVAGGFAVAYGMFAFLVQAGMLLLTFLTVMNNLHDGETNAIEGISHFALFAAFIALVMMGLI